MLCMHNYNHVTVVAYMAVVTPRTCVRGKVIVLSVCHLWRCHCPQKIGRFRDLQVQASRGWYKTVQLGEKLTYLCSYLLLTIYECDKSRFYMPRLFATPTEAIQLYMQLCIVTAHAQALYR